MQRPIIERGERAVLGRPTENVKSYSKNRSLAWAIEIRDSVSPLRL